MKVGDIIYFDQFDPNTDGGLTSGVWARVHEVTDPLDEHGFHFTVFYTESSPVSKSDVRPGFQDFPCNRDEYRVVPDDQITDRICAELAKWRLLGEVNE